MDQEDDSVQVVKTESLEEPKTPIANDPDSVSSFVDSDSSEDDNNRERIITSLSPLCNQYSEKMRIDSSCDCDLVSDEEIVETMYQNLLRIIVSMQIRCNNVGIGEIWCFDGCKTPPSTHPESKMMVPDTCPGAPMKVVKITRNIDSGLRRKLF